MDLRFAICDLRLSSPRPRVAASPRPLASLSPRPRVSASPRPHSRPGFTFTEILFAVMILGIGFIMVAAIFPVAIQQTEANNQETIAASIGRSATGFVEKVAQGQAIILNPNPLAWPPSPSQPQTATPGSPNAPTSVLAPTFESSPTPLIPLFMAGQTTLIIPGEVWSFREPKRDPYTYSFGTTHPPHWPLLWNGIARNLVVPSDPRFAAVVMYKRDLIAQKVVVSTPLPTFHPAPFAQVIVIGVQARNKQVYTMAGSPSDIFVLPNSPTPPTLVPKLFTGIKITRNALGVSQITVGNAANSPIAENTYVVISRDFTFALNDPQQRYGHFNGRIFRIGNFVGGNTWELAPGSDLTTGDSTVLNGRNLVADVLVVGRAVDPNNPNQFTGLAQDVSVYSSYVQIPN